MITLLRKIARFVSNVTLFGGVIAIGWGIYSRLFVRHNVRIGSAVDAPRESFKSDHSGMISYYADTSASGTPLILIHSINAAASAYEMRPLFEYYRGKRPVYAIDLPGFGFSERSDRGYHIALYVNAILEFIGHLQLDEKPDVIALSLSSEFVAQAAHNDPQHFRSLTFISPTGLSQFRSDNPPSGNDELLNFLKNPLVRQPLFDALASRASIRWFLQKSFHGTVDGDLIEYAWRSSHQDGAFYAPLAFISGKLFNRNIAANVYANLNVPTLVLYDSDPNVSFEAIQQVIQVNTLWRARIVRNTRGLPHFEALDKVTEYLDAFWTDIQ